MPHFNLFLTLNYTALFKFSPLPSLRVLIYQSYSQSLASFCLSSFSPFPFDCIHLNQSTLFFSHCLNNYFFLQLLVFYYLSFTLLFLLLYPLSLSLSLSLFHFRFDLTMNAEKVPQRTTHSTLALPQQSAAILFRFKWSNLF